VALPLGLLLGVLAASRQNTWIDYAASTTATLGLTVPSFVVAVWLVLLFAVQLRWLPTGGWGEWYHYIMPVIGAGAGADGADRALHAHQHPRSLALGLHPHGALQRPVRPPDLWRHTLRNAMIPLLTILAPQIPNLITGTIFIESIFRVPGLGKFFVTSILRSRLSHDHGAAAAGGGGLVAGLSHHRYSLHDRRPARAAGTRKAHEHFRFRLPRPLPSLPKPAHLLGDAARRFSRNKLALVGLIPRRAAGIFAAIFADFLAPYPYDAADPARRCSFPAPNTGWAPTRSAAMSTRASSMARASRWPSGWA
jgi:hypothetical protein